MLKYKILKKNIYTRSFQKWTNLRYTYFILKVMNKWRCVQYYLFLPPQACLLIQFLVSLHIIKSLNTYQALTSPSVFSSKNTSRVKIWRDLKRQRICLSMLIQVQVKNSCKNSCLEVNTAISYDKIVEL